MDQIGELSARQDLAESKYPRATYLALWRTGAGAPQDSIKASPDKIRPKAFASNSNPSYLLPVAEKEFPISGPQVSCETVAVVPCSSQCFEVTIDK